ncbi:MAG: LamG domain-containing protein [Candidatus Poribacteria bacterium]|nr:LamG domain-containing protein [Candidatus Poribacteria bacterium]
MKLFTFVLAVTFLLMSTTLGITGEDPDLVAYYPFDGDSEDATGNDNHGEITGGSKWVKGKFGDAIELDAAAYVEMQASDSLHGDFFKEDPFTISAWINPNFEGTTWEHIWRSLPSAVGHNTLFINKDQGLISWRGRVGGWTVLCQTDGGIVEADKWMHVAVTGDGDKFKIYADGEIVAETDFQKTDGGNVTYRMGGSGGETFAGLLDDYAVFSRALDEDEISLIMEGVETFLPVEPQGKLATQWAKLKR